jgi:hypothetical protein
LRGAGCEDQHERQDAADQHLAEPEGRSVDAAVEQEEAFVGGLPGEVEAGQVHHGGEVERRADEHGEQVLHAGEDALVQLRLFQAYIEPCTMRKAARPRREP